ncbi:MAG: ATP-binding cassette domain-containing protein [Verrucomicrobia subdivision 3 bacterium]|nr:ATP-binding cassette domain-containing protein [Limisphaerales bacterium]
MIACKQVTKRFGAVTALAPFDLEVASGEFIAIKGASGSGKTTLLLTLGGMLRPSAGTVTFDGADLYAQSPATRANYRATDVGFVFQMFHLVPYLGVEENVRLAGRNGSMTQRPRELLKQFGLGHRLTHTPGELSAGERQRVALARALVNEPRLILADEPTGNLDPENDRQVFGHLAEFHRAGGTVVVVTHGSTADEFADRVVSLETAP